jgi:hypothetical protein
MKKTIMMLLASVLMVGAAEAGNKNNDKEKTYNYNYTYKYKYDYGNNNEGWYAFGGLLGGLLIGQALNNPGPGVYADPYAARVTPQQYCGTQWERRWNEIYQTWENIPHTVCWVQ